MRKLGYRGTDEKLYARFFAEARKMRRGAWRTEFTTREINEYFRADSGIGRLPLDKLPPVECGIFERTFSYRREDDRPSRSKGVRRVPFGLYLGNPLKNR